MVSLHSVSLSDVTAHTTPTSATSPVSTAAKATDSSIKMTSAANESEIAFPAVLKGSQKQRVPPPVPPRGSPKAKRGASSHLSLDTKGEYSISASDIQSQTPNASSNDDFSCCGRELTYHEPPACRIQSSVSDLPVKLTELTASNSFLDYLEVGPSIVERSNKDLNSQTAMMAKFSLERIFREHLDSGEYNDTSFTESSSEDQIVTNDFVEKLNKDNDGDVKGKKSKTPSRFSKDEDKSSSGAGSIERVSVHNIKSSDLITAAQSLKKTPKLSNELNKSESQVKHGTSNSKISKPDTKSGFINDITIKCNVPTRKDKIIPKTSKPKVELRTYIEGHAKGGMSKDVIVCQRKAKSKIELFQKHILKLQSDSENSSRRSSVTSLYDSKTSKTNDKSVNEAKMVFEKSPVSESAKAKPVALISFAGNVHNKIKQFSENALAISTPRKVPRQKKKGSIKKKTDRKRILAMKKDLEEIL